MRRLHDEKVKREHVAATGSLHARAPFHERARGEHWTLVTFTGRERERICQVYIDADGTTQSTCTRIVERERERERRGEAYSGGSRVDRGVTRSCCLSFFANVQERNARGRSGQPKWHRERPGVYLAYRERAERESFNLNDLTFLVCS